MVNKCLKGTLVYSRTLWTRVLIDNLRNRNGQVRCCNRVYIMYL